MLFVYGTLRDPDMLGLVLGGLSQAVSMRPASVPCHRAVSYPGRVYPALVPCPTDAAPGLVIVGLSSDDLAKLDAFEGAEYVRGMIGVVVEGQDQQAETYLPVAAIAADAPVWSLVDWRLHHKAAMLAREAATLVGTGGSVP